MEYKNNSSFLNAVKNNDLKMVKSQLTEMIMLFQGDKSELVEAVNYAEKNCSFQFEEHRPTKTQVDDTSNSDLFYTEKVELRDNFSKERFEEVIRLYPLMVGEDDFYSKAKVNSDDDNNSKQSSSNVNIKTYLIIGTSAIIVGYIIYRTLK